LPAANEVSFSLAEVDQPLAAEIESPDVTMPVGEEQEGRIAHLRASVAGVDVGTLRARLDRLDPVATSEEYQIVTAELDRAEQNEPPRAPSLRRHLAALRVKLENLNRLQRLGLLDTVNDRLELGRQIRITEDELRQLGQPFDEPEIAAPDRFAVMEQDLRDELDLLETRRRRLAPEVLAGEGTARAELVEIDSAIAEAELRLGLVDAGRAEAAHRAVAEAAQAAADAKAQEEEERDVAIAVRNTRLREFQLVRGALIEKLSALIDADDATSALGEASIRNAVVRLVVIAIQDAGVRPTTHEPVHGGERQRLLEAFPLVKSEKGEIRREVDRLSPTLRAELDARLAAGEPLRDLERAFAVSRSALSRYKRAQLKDQTRG
jgi:hypothetical protein